METPFRGISAADALLEVSSDGKPPFRCISARDVDLTYTSSHPTPKAHTLTFSAHIHLWMIGR